MENNIPGFLKTLFTGSASGLIDSISSVIKDFKVTPEDQQKLIELANKHDEILSNKAIEFYETQVKDIQSARDMQTKISFSANNFLSKNIVSLLAILIIFCCLSTFFFSKELNLDVETKTTIRDVMLIVITFYFGSSKSSKDKSEVINNMNEKNQ